MKTGIVILWLAFLASIALAGDLQVTVYNSNLGVIKDSRIVKLERGVNELTVSDVAARIDPTSVRVKIGGQGRVDVLEQNFEYDLLSPDRLLEKYIDSDVSVSTDDGKDYSGRLLGFDRNNVVISAADGTVAIVARNKVSHIELGPGHKGLVTSPTLFWKVNSTRRTSAGMELAYITKDISWHAEYVAILGRAEDEVELAAWVSIDNKSGATYKDAKLKLVAGEVHMAAPPPTAPGYKVIGVEFKAAAPVVTERPFFEYHMYSLEGTTTIKDREVKQVRLFPETQVSVAKEYNYDVRKQDAVRVVMKFTNSSEAGLGIPLPAGKVRVYKVDEDGALEFVGEDTIDHTPKDEDVKVYVGNAFDISAKRTRKDHQKVAERTVQETFEIELANHKSEDVTVVVTEHIYGDWEIRRTSHEYKKVKADEVEFEVSVPANQKSILTYTVRRTS